MERENRAQPELTNQGAQFKLEEGTSMDPQTEQQQTGGNQGPRRETGRGREDREEREYEHFTFSPEALAELNKDEFDLDSVALSEFNTEVESLIPRNTRAFETWADDILKAPIINERTIIKAKRLMFEKLVEKVIRQFDPVEDAHYRLDLYAESTLTSLKALSRRFEYLPNYDFPAGEERGESFEKYIGHLIDIRQEAHELRRNLTTGENYKKFLSEGLKAHGLDVMRNDIAGVSEVESLYETFSTLKLAERDTKDWFTQGDVNSIDKEVEETILGMVRDKKLLKDGRVMTEWEARRALAIGKTLFAGTQRFALYAGVGDIPGGDVARVGSTPYEYIVRTLFGEKMAGARYFNDKASFAFQKKAFGFMKEDLQERKKVLLKLFGIGLNTWFVNKLGALTPADQRWRAQLMYLGSIKLNGIENAPSLVDYLERVREDFGMHLDLDPDIGGNLVDQTRGLYDSPHPEDYDSALGFDLSEEWKDPQTGMPELNKEGKPKTKEDKLKEFYSSGQRADMILGQRLYLSNLVKFGMVTSDMKADIWKKVAIFDPLGFSAFLPEQVKATLSVHELALWQGKEGNLRQKLARAALTRLRVEGDLYKAGLSYAQLQREANAFRAMNDNYKYQMIDRYFEAEDRLAPEEEAVVRKMIDFGIRQAGTMAYLDVPFSFLINDAPRVAWEKTGEGLGGLGHENLNRILVSDQGNLSEAWGEINSLVEHPVGTERLEKGPIGKELAEHLLKFIEGYSRVHGRAAAQKIVRPFIKAWIDMAAMYPHSTWVGGVEKGLRKPRSDFEKFYRVNFLALDEEARAALLDALAVMGIVSSDVSHGKADLEVLKEEHKADRKYLALKMFRELLLLFGPIVALELVKIFFPEEVSKGLGIKS